MYVKKRMSLLLFAALAMVLFTACGRWDFSREAAKAANEAQNAVVFEASATLAQSLKDALEDKVQTADVKAAMDADERLADLLGRLDVYAVEGDDAEAAAQTIAEGYIKGRVSGRQSDGSIAMVKADNGWFYAAVVTTPTGGSGSDDGNGGNDPGTTPGEDEGENPGTDPDEGEDENPGEDETKTYTVTVADNITGGTVTVSQRGEVKAGTEITITAEPQSSYYKLVQVTANNNEIEYTNGSYTYTVNENVTISATFAEREVGSIELVIPAGEKFDIGDTIFYDQGIFRKTFRDGISLKIFDTDGELIETIEADKLKTMVDNGTLSATYEEIGNGSQNLGFVKSGNQDVTISYNVDGKTVTGTVRNVFVTVFDYSRSSN